MMVENLPSYRVSRDRNYSGWIMGYKNHEPIVWLKKSGALAASKFIASDSREAQSIIDNFVETGHYPVDAREYTET